MDPDTIWYDGSWRVRGEAIARIERDAASFLADRIRDFDSDHLAWRFLVDELRVPFLDELSQHTMKHGYEVEWRQGEVIVHLAPIYPRTLAAIFAAAREQPWCVDATLETGKVTMRVELDSFQARRIESDIRATAANVRDEARRGVGTFLYLIHPGGSPQITAELDATLREIDRIEAGKIGGLQRVTRS